MPNILGVRFGSKQKNTARRVSETSRAAAIEEARELLRQNPDGNRQDLTDRLVENRQLAGKTFRGLDARSLPRRTRIRKRAR